MRTRSHKPALVRHFHRLVQWIKWAWMLERVCRACEMLVEVM
ncbi:hypothetical protein [Hyphomicrobium sp. NDB2Meth4]|nr:hypothetical protein [Hyphomicrobium sp. NDB2Meth4]